MKKEGGGLKAINPEPGEMRVRKQNKENYGIY